MKFNFRRGFAVVLCMAMVLGLLSGAFGGASVANAAAPADGNLIANPSFEDTGLNGWSAGMQSNTEKFAGAYAMKLQDTSATAAVESVSDPITVAKAAYIASAMVKSNGVLATIGLRYLDANGQELSYVAAESDPGATGWQELSVKAVAPANAQKVVIVLSTGVAAQGDVYFDNVEMAATADAAIDPVISNGNFEHEKTDWLDGNTGDTCTQSVVSADGNNHVLQMDKTAGDGSRAGIKTERVQLTEGKVYNLTLDAKKISGGGNLCVQIYLYTDQTGNVGQNATATYGVGSDWQTINLSTFVPAGYTWAYIDISWRNGVGVVQLDNISLDLAESEIINGSFDGAVMNDGSPDGWSKSAGGTSWHHSVVSGGITGNALQLEKTSDGSGDVFSNYIPVTPGENYEFSVYLKGDAVTSLTQIIPYYYTTGSVLGTNSAALGVYITAATVTPSADWTKYTVTFTAPRAQLQYVRDC